MPPGEAHWGRPLPVIRDAKIPPPTQVPCRGVQLSAASACGQFCVTGSLSDHPTRIVPALRRRQTGGSPSRWTELVELELPGLPWLVAAVVGGLGLGLGLAGAGWAGGSPHFRKQRRNASLGVRCDAACLARSPEACFMHDEEGFDIPRQWWMPQMLFLSEACGQRRHDGTRSDPRSADRIGSAHALSSRMPSPECLSSTTKRHYTVREQAHRSTAAAIDGHRTANSQARRHPSIMARLDHRCLVLCTVHRTAAYSQRWEFRMPLCSEWGLPLPRSTRQAHAQPSVPSLIGLPVVYLFVDGAKKSAVPERERDGLAPHRVTHNFPQTSNQPLTMRRRGSHESLRLAEWGPQQIWPPRDAVSM
jgi:hypothetical protein